MPGPVLSSHTRCRSTANTMYSINTTYPLLNPSCIIWPIHGIVWHISGYGQSTPCLCVCFLVHVVYISAPHVFTEWGFIIFVTELCNFLCSFFPLTQPINQFKSRWFFLSGSLLTESANATPASSVFPRCPTNMREMGWISWWNMMDRDWKHNVLNVFNHNIIRL